ncbi:hypothetical protein GN109_05855 [Collimonas pratensis]|uniref:hypothetical protein n=1 Tax=Collimonas pratensis TaxID=279113 RepID=UPI00143CD1E7|nr:hypothetical protein [Collimonas pratensis]NKI68938.1 hypothetical protein [Collimonas pratensis]
MKSTKQKIMAIIQENDPKRLSGYMIARRLSLATKDIRVELGELISEGRLVTTEPGHNVLYHIPTAADLARPAPSFQSVKPYNPIGPAWQIVKDRLREFREIKSLIRSAP